MKKENFYSEDFYKNPELTLSTLNELLATNQIADQDVYESGGLLFVEVHENDQTKELLSRIISDLDAYKSYDSAGYYASGKQSRIGLCALCNDHRHYFGNSKEIVWNKGSERFVFAECLQ